MSVNAVFEYTELSGALETETTAHGLKKGASTVEIPSEEPEVIETGVAYTSGNEADGVTLTFTPGTDAKTLATDFLTINGVDASAWSSFATNVTFNDNVITISSTAFSFGSITGSAGASEHRYTFTVKDSEGTVYSTGEVTVS